MLQSATRMRLISLLLAFTLLSACQPLPPLVPTPPPNATPLPFQIPKGGAITYRLTTETSDMVASLEMPSGKKELLINVYDGLNGRIVRVQWGGAEIVEQILSDQLQQPRVSPDGRAIVFDGLWLGDTDGKNLQLIAPDGHSPSWSPDSTEVAFVRSVPIHGTTCNEDEADICVSIDLFDVRTHAQQTILTAPGLSGPPDWSPDKRYLLIGQGGEVGTALSVVEIASGKMTMLVPNSETPPEANIFLASTWSPDSRHVVYETQSNSLWEVPVTGSAPTLLAERGRFPFWPKNQRWLYYLSPPSESHYGSVYEIWRRDPTQPQTTAERVTDDLVNCDRAIWSDALDVLACIGTVGDDQVVKIYQLPSWIQNLQ